MPRRPPPPHRRDRVPRPPRPRRAMSVLAEYIQTETAGGVVLAVATVAALAWANSPWDSLYRDVWHFQLTIGIRPLAITEDLVHWVNDGLMAIFFFVVGLEIKRELVTGELRDRKAAGLPVVAALGGMVVPALLFTAVAGGGAAGRGWGIPMATDIAFVVGVLALLGPRVPSGLKLFVLTLAIVDDLGAIVVIAGFYSASVEPLWLVVAAATLLLVVLARVAGVTSPLAYAPLAVLAWVATFESGIHPTIAGVAVGLLTPARPVKGRQVLEELEHRLHPFSSFLIVPVFALANAGVPLGGGVVGAALGGRTAWAVIVGLVVGKTVGIAAATMFALRLRVGRLPADVTRGQIGGAAALAGIGFTVSLFITGLAYESQSLIDQARVGILIASLGAGVVGAAVLFVLLHRPAATTEPRARS